MDYIIEHMDDYVHIKVKKQEKWAECLVSSEINTTFAHDTSQQYDYGNISSIPANRFARRRSLGFVSVSDKKVRKAFRQKLQEEENVEAAMAQQKMVKESLTKAFDELHTGKAKHDARSLFLK